MADLKHMLQQINNHQVLIIGDLMLDEYIWGDVLRISPEAPVPIVQIQGRSYRPGGASNVAASIAAIGSKPYLAGVIGNDEAAQHLRRALGENGIINHEGLLTVNDRPTTHKSRIIAHNQQMLRCDSETTERLEFHVENQLIEWAVSQIATVDVCILSDYAKGVLSHHVCQSIIQAAQKRRIPVVVDPKGTSYDRYRGATVITPNVHEISVATNKDIRTVEELDVAATQLVRMLNLAVVVTRSADGMALYQPEQQSMYVPALARTVYDVTGAGDTVVAMIALALASGQTLAAAMSLATIAASVVVAKLGTATVTIDEIRRIVERNHGSLT